MPNIDPNALASTLTIRQEFAKAAMQGLLAFYADASATPSIEQVTKLVGVTPGEYVNEKHWPMFIAQEAVKQADALIAVLNEKEDGQ